MTILDAILAREGYNGVPQIGGFRWFHGQEKGELCLEITRHRYGNIHTGGDWVGRLTHLAMKVSEDALFVLTSGNYVPYTDPKCLLTVVRNPVTYSELEKEFRNMRLLPPPLAVACILREVCLDYMLEDMNLMRIIVMHEPVLDVDGNPCRLGIFQDGSGNWLDVYYEHPGALQPGTGYAYLSP